MPLFQAVINKDARLPFAKALVGAGYRGDACGNTFNETPLMWAAVNGSPQALRWLLEEVPQAKATLEWKDCSG